MRWLMSEEWFTVAEVARLARVSERTVYRWIDVGALPSTKLSGKWFVNATDLIYFKNNSK